MTELENFTRRVALSGVSMPRKLVIALYQEVCLLPTVSALPFRLNMPAEDVQGTMSRLVECGVVRLTSRGCYAHVEG